MKFPYGRRDFYELMTEQYIYLDRTQHIRFIEEWGKELLLLRPRRFGKSLWLSTLMNYYDVAKADAFARLFGPLAIGKNPTPLHNHYLVMRWDFSTVMSHGPIEQIERALHNQINVNCQNFQRTYASYLNDKIDVYRDDALATFSSLLNVVQISGHKLYLFIDEYDNFANEVLMGTQGNNQQRYLDLVKGEGMFKTLFKNIKSAASGAGLERVYMTGVSPIVMNDASSGANVNEDIYWFQQVNDLCGFREDEVADLVSRLAAEQGFTSIRAREAMEMMRIFYNGSWFTTEVAPPERRGKDATLSATAATAAPLNETPPISHLYNPTLVFYFLRYWQRTGEYPPNMLDRNLQTDSNKLAYVAGFPMGKPLLVAALNEETISVSEIGTDFGVQQMWQPDMQDERLASVLCYLGSLTISGILPAGKTQLRIPNLVIRKLYAERILLLTVEAPSKQSVAKSAADALFARGEIQPLCTFIEQELLAVYANRDYLHFNELTLKTLFLSLLYYNHLYIMDSEPALQRGYGDLSMIIRPGMRHYTVFDLLFEFKFLPLSKVTSKPEGAKGSKGTRTLTGEEIKQMSHPDLAGLDAVVNQLAEARTQLQRYRQTLQAKYGAELKLRTYAIVAVGFERLVWEEVQQ
ncbi:MAG: AAA family ATPase [Caldilineaceae bacterium]